MATSSTRSARKLTHGAAAAYDTTPQAQPALAGHTVIGREVPERTWLVAYYAVLAVALLLRVVALELRPMHHDEGVNGHFLLGLMRNGVFRYDPSNYHGPTLYYFTLPLAYAADSAGRLSTWVVRLVPVAFGMGTVWLGLSLRRYVGAVGALAAGALMAVSPGLVFFSRYFIHEMLFVFFTLGLVVAALRCYEMGARARAGERGTAKGRGALREGGGNAAAGGGPVGAGVAGDGGGLNDLALGAGVALASAALVAATLLAAYRSEQLKVWLPVAALCLGALFVLLWLYDGARTVYLVLGAVSAGLLFATKETAFISVGVLLIAWATTELWVRLGRRAGWSREPEPKRKKGKDKRAAREPPPAAADGRNLVERFGGWGHVAPLLVAAVCIFLFVNVAYYSSFFTHEKGVLDSLEAFKIWTKTGQSGFHGYKWHKYIAWLRDEETPLVALAALGALLSLWKTRRRFPLFAAQWGFGLLAAYSLIAYKTPWLVLSMLVPFALAGGYAVDRLYRRGGAGWRVVSLALLGGCLAVMLYQTYRVNFVNYDDDRYPYVYAHTRRSFHDLMAAAELIAARVGGAEGKQKASFNIAVENQEYWPLPWYVRDWKRIGYVGRVTQTNDDMVLIKDSQVAELEAMLGDRYRRVGGVYELRPGVKHVLYARQELVR